MMLNQRIEQMSNARIAVTTRLQGEWQKPILKTDIHEVQKWTLMNLQTANQKRETSYKLKKWLNETTQGVSGTIRNSIKSQSPVKIEATPALISDKIQSIYAKVELIGGKPSPKVIDKSEFLKKQKKHWSRSLPITKYFSEPKAQRPEIKETEPSTNFKTIHQAIYGEFGE